MSPKYKEAQREPRCYFSGVSQHRVVREFFSSFRSTLHILSQMTLDHVWNWSLLRRKGEMQSCVRRRSYYLNLCEAHGMNTWGQFLHLMYNGRKFSTMRRTSCPSLSRVLSTRSSCSASPASPTSLSKEKKMCPATIRSENMGVQAQGDLSHTQSQDDEQHGEPRYRLNCHEEKCNQKRIHTHFLKDQNCEMQEGQNYLNSMQETHGRSHTSSSKIWENW